jgi:hypothetical protein
MMLPIVLCVIVVAIVVLIVLLLLYSLSGSLEKSRVTREQCSTTPILTRKVSNASPVTVVTAYFIVPTNKHSKSDYRTWIGNFMRMKCNMVVFTDAESVVWLRKLRNDDSVIYIIEEPSQWYNYRWKSYYEKSYEMDAEKSLHSPYLSMLWNEKCFFLQRATRMNLFSSKWFVWTDIGSVRDVSRLVMTYPNVEVLASIPEDRLLVFQVEPFRVGDYEKTTEGIYTIFANKNERIGCKSVNRIQAGCFGGTVHAIDRWVEHYTHTLERFIEHGNYIGKEQNNMSQVVMDHPEIVHSVLVPENSTVDRWFWFYMYLG